MHKPCPAACRVQPSSSSFPCSAAEQALLLRSRLQLSEMVLHPAFGVCFQLEYVVCAAAKAAAGSALGPAAAMHTVRWALWSPFLGATSSPVLLSLRGGAHPSPGQTLVYRNPADSESSQQVKRIASGCVQFHVSTDAEHGVTSTDVSSKAGKELQEPPTPSLTVPLTAAGLTAGQG